MSSTTETHQGLNHLSKSQIAGVRDDEELKKEEGGEKNTIWKMLTVRENLSERFKEPDRGTCVKVWLIDELHKYRIYPTL